MDKVTNIEGVKRLSLKVRNWGRWGPDDELGTVNFVTPDKIVKAAQLVKKGKVFALGIPIDEDGPQRKVLGSKRFNAIHTMFRDGSDTIAGVPMARPPKGWGGCDDMVVLCTHGGTHWDALCHVHFEGRKIWNGYSAELCGSFGALKNGIEKYKNRLVGCGVLLDVARWKKVNWLELGYGITGEDLDKCAAWEKVNIESGDFLLVRTGQMRQVKEQGKWGDYVGGDAPGLTVETAEWLYKKEIAAVASDTWSVEVRPNATHDIYQPWHKIVLPNMGLLIGEILDLEELAEDCDEDKVYEFMFVAHPLLITGGAGSPVNPYAIK